MKNRLFRNEKGLTIAELLATLVITSIIVIIITSMYVVVQKQYFSQQEDVSNLTDVKIALKAITRDIRKADEVDIDGTNYIRIHIAGESDTTDYYWDNDKTLYKNETAYILNVTNFNVDLVENKIVLNIESKEQKESTEIVIRE